MCELGKRECGTSTCRDSFDMKERVRSAVVVSSSHRLGTTPARVNGSHVSHESKIGYWSI